MFEFQKILQLIAQLEPENFQNYKFLTSKVITSKHFWFQKMLITNDFSSEVIQSRDMLWSSL